MRADRFAQIGLAVALLLFGGVAWSFALRPALHVDAHRLLALPLAIGPWEGRDIPLEQTVEDMLHADANVQRVYEGPLGSIVWLYIGYYGTARGGAPEHTPRACYQAHGWRIQADRTVVVDPARGLRADELVVESDGQRRLVHFWYRSRRSDGILGAIGLGVDHVIDRFSSGRADGALIRLSTPIEDGDEVVARSRLDAFAAELLPKLRGRWPQEQAEGAARGRADREGGPLRGRRG